MADMNKKSLHKMKRGGGYEPMYASKKKSDAVKTAQNLRKEGHRAVMTKGGIGKKRGGSGYTYSVWWKKGNWSVTSKKRVIRRAKTTKALKRKSYKRK